MPCLPGAFRPLPNERNMFVRIPGAVNIDNGDYAARWRRPQPDKICLRFSSFEHRIIRTAHRQTAFQQKAESNQMDGHRLNALR